jgi:hypothetical protein
MRNKSFYCFAQGFGERQGVKALVVAAHAWLAEGSPARLTAAVE